MPGESIIFLGVDKLPIEFVRRRCGAEVGQEKGLLIPRAQTAPYRVTFPPRESPRPFQKITTGLLTHHAGHGSSGMAYTGMSPSLVVFTS